MKHLTHVQLAGGPISDEERARMKAEAQRAIDASREACGCSLVERCDRHGDMMSEIHEAWQHGSEFTCDVIWSLSDGYGEPGFVPSQGYDWSGIRDSSTRAVEAMYQALHA